MEYLVCTPAAPAGRYVETITYYAGAMPMHRRERLLPEGAVQIIVDLTETPKRLYRDAVGGEGIDFRRAWISGMQRRPLVIEAQPASSMLILRFRPGGAEALLGHPADLLTDSVMSLADILGDTSASLRDRLLETEGAAGRVAAAAEWVVETAARSTADPLAEYVAARLARGGTAVGALARELGYSDRQIRTRFRRAVGLTPKQYARIHRFRRVVSLLCARAQRDNELVGDPLSPPDWADLAAELGYADQPHLVNEFRAFSGMTPGAYVSAYRGLENYLPIG